MEKVDTHHQLPKGVLERELTELEFNNITTYQDDVGMSWAISHNDIQYDIVYALIDSYE